MKILIMLSISVLLMISCDEKECCIVGPDRLFEFSVLNNAGLDLLDQDNVESFTQSNIRIYNSDGNVVFNSNSDAHMAIVFILEEI